MKKIVVLFVAITGLLVAADFGAAAVAEHWVAQRMRTELGMTSEPVVRINGFPFLAQAVAGDYPDVEVVADRVPYGLLQVSPRAHLRHARVPLSALSGAEAPTMRIDQVEGTVLIGLDGLAGLLGIPDLRVDPVSPAQLTTLRTDAANELAASGAAAPTDPASLVQLSGTAPGLGVPVTVIAAVDVADGKIRITGRTIQVGSDDALGELLPEPVQQAILRELTVGFDPGTILFGARPTSVTVEDGALAISFDGRDLTVHG